MSSPPEGVGSAEGEAKGMDRRSARGSRPPLALVVRAKSLRLSPPARAVERYRRT
jgi:hypothetical protein